MSKPIAVIIGSSGQDGKFLTDKLFGLGYAVVGITKDTIDITNANEVNELITNTLPAEIYFLASYHHSSEEVLGNEGDLLRKSIDIQFISAVNFLDAIAIHSPTSRFFYASSRLVFSKQGNMQTEDTELRPECAYGISKVAGMNACRYYRMKKDVFASTGILYNHESSLRDKKFLSRKIISAAAHIAREGKGTLILGNLDNIIDWGYAPDYVDAMTRILKLPVPNDYIIATGIGHSVRQFAELAFGYYGLDYRKYVKVQSQIMVRKNLSMIGDSSRLQNDTGWKPTVNFEEMVCLMAKAEYESFNEK